MSKRYGGRLRRLSRAGAGAGGLLVVACSLQELDHLGNQYGLGRDGGVGNSLNTSGSGGAGGALGMGGSRPSDGGTGGAAAGASGTGGGGAGGSAGEGTSGSGGAGGSAGTAPINYGGSAGFITYPADGGPDPNLIEDPGFELGVGSWSPQGSPTLTWETEGPLAGARCLRASRRTEIWMGPSYDLKDAIIPGATYHLSVWIRLSQATVVKFSTKTTCQGEASTFLPIVDAASASTSWRLFEGDFLAPTCTLTDFRIFAEESPDGVDIFLDEVRVVPVP